MALPSALSALWEELQLVRAEILKEAEGLSQSQADWRPRESEWSIGEILHHLTVAEVNTGKLTSKLLKEAGERAASFPAGLAKLAPLPPWPSGMEAPPLVRPEKGQPIERLLADMKAARERSCQSLERLASVDPRPLTWRHFALGELDLAQWWMLQARHDQDHLQQLLAIKATPGFPKS